MEYSLAPDRRRLRGAILLALALDAGLWALGYLSLGRSRPSAVTVEPSVLVLTLEDPPGSAQPSAPPAPRLSVPASSTLTSATPASATPASAASTSSPATSLATASAAPASPASASPEPVINPANLSVVAPTVAAAVESAGIPRAEETFPGLPERSPVAEHSTENVSNHPSALPSTLPSGATLTSISAPSSETGRTEQAGGPAVSMTDPLSASLTSGSSGLSATAERSVQRGEGQPASQERSRDALYGILNRLIQERLSYPPLAKQRNIQGVVGLRIVVSPEGKLLSLTLGQSSQSSILDRAAKTLVETLFPLSEVPDLGGNETMLIQVRYVLTPF